MFPSVGVSNRVRGSLSVPLSTGCATSRADDVDSISATDASVADDEKDIEIMSEKQTWLVTGAGRGMGVEFARAALAAGHHVVATGRNPDTVALRGRRARNLLVTALDVTDPHSAEAAAATAVDRFGRIDVLVNNAGSL